MKYKQLTLLFLFLLLSTLSRSQKTNNKPSEKADTIKNLNEVVISASRLKTPLKEIPATISLITGNQLNSMNKSINAEDIFRLVPGVKIENGTGGSRVHVYMRGQGVLTESGFRGIGVMVDGITINNPGGFAPDLYDIDWESVKSVEVLKGLAASMYGAGSTAGVINITTNDGSEMPFKGSVYLSAGSYGFWKTQAQVGGTKGDVNYRISYSHMQGNGYREHQAFMGDNFSEKLNWRPNSRIKLTQLLNYSSYFNQNSEGISYYRYLNFGPRAANTDAVPFNEFHKTQRLTGASILNFDLGQNQNILLKSFFRLNNYRETSNNGDDYKPFISPGFSAQYNRNDGTEMLLNHLSIGTDIQSQTMTEHMFGGIHDLSRTDTHFGESYIDTEELKINQIILQRSFGIYLIDKLDIAKKLYATLNLRYDNVYNNLENKKPDSKSSDNRSFDKPTFRLGLAYDLAKVANIYASFGTGYLVPTGDELLNNYDNGGEGGFNTGIKPSTVQQMEFGVRGELGKMLYYNLTAFNINAKDEFYRLASGSQTAYFGNIGESKRTGLEAYISANPIDPFNLSVAYTYSNFKYTSPGTVKDQTIPQCPEHMLTAEASYKFLRHFTLTLNTELQSKWCIQTDSAIYNNYIEVTQDTIVNTRSSWVDGYSLFNASLKYDWKIGTLYGDLSLFAKNFFDEHYFGFTEPNSGPDYNSYQPAAGREFFVSLRVRF
ncbi:MAG: TonB-dependent receptor [Bacteroidetes bacterium]|nr:TonB-dependent receptor [Bacteroidota bacterium]